MLNWRNTPSASRAREAPGARLLPGRLRARAADLMTEIAVYGLPIRMPHWSFGVRYIHQLVRQSMGHSKIFEVMFPGDPCRAFLMDTNSLAENALVTAHVIGTPTSPRTTSSSRASTTWPAATSSSTPRRTRTASSRRSTRRAWSASRRARRRSRSSRTWTSTASCTARAIRSSSREAEAAGERVPAALPGLPGVSEPEAAPPGLEAVRSAASRPPRIRLLWFIANYARARAVGARHLPRGARRVALLLPGVRLSDHERGLGLVLARAPAARGDFLPQPTYLAAIKAHSDVVRPFASGEETALAINPYHPRLHALGRSSTHGLRARAR